MSNKITFPQPLLNGWEDDPLDPGLPVPPVPPVVWTHQKVLEWLIRWEPAPAVHSRPTKAPLRPEDLIECFRDAKAATYVFLNARDYADVRRLGRDHLTIEIIAERLRKGIMGTFWDPYSQKPVQVITTQRLKAGTIWVVAGVGVKPDRALMLKVSR